MVSALLAEPSLQPHEVFLDTLDVSPWLPYPWRLVCHIPYPKAWLPSICCGQADKFSKSSGCDLFASVLVSSVRLGSEKALSWGFLRRPSVLTDTVRVCTSAPLHEFRLTALQRPASMGTSPSPLRNLVPVLSCFSACTADGRQNRDRKGQAEDFCNRHLQLSQAGWGASMSGLLGPGVLYTPLLGDFGIVKRDLERTGLQHIGRAFVQHSIQGPLIPSTAPKEKQMNK